MTLARIKLPLVLASSSLILLIIIFLATSPVNNIAFVVVFFCLLYIFLNSSFYLATCLQYGSVNKRSRQRIILASTSLMVFMMFLTTRSLNLVDILILILIIYGLYFYSGRR